MVGLLVGHPASAVTRSVSNKFQRLPDHGGPDPALVDMTNDEIPPKQLLGHFVD